ncbi:MAG: hypothetical protein ACREN5_00755 [Gemmatimonadales bacterium]
MAVIPLAGADATMAVSPFFTSGGAPGADAERYRHQDCVGPGLPGTVGAHSPNPHTVSVPGFGAGSVTIAIQSLNLGGPGICPLTLGALPLLSQDYTGSYTATFRCGAGTQNPGALFGSFTSSYLAGLPTGGSFTPGTCFVPVGGSWSVVTTIGHSDTSLLGVPLPPTGAILLTLTQ